VAKKSGSKRTDGGSGGLEGVMAGLKRDTAPALAKALNLDSAEAVEAAMNAAMEVALAARAVIRAMPMPPEAREHLDRAEAETLRAARMAARGLNLKPAAKKTGPAKRVAVDFKAPAQPAGKRAGKPGPKAGARKGR
jgi:hypothetical protein